MATDRATGAAWPKDFSDWPRPDQVDRVMLAYNREGLMRDILLAAGADLKESRMPVGQLGKAELAAIWDALGCAPTAVASWSRDGRLEHAQANSREGLLRDILATADINVREREIRHDTKLRKEDLAAIYLTLEGY